MIPPIIASVSGVPKSGKTHIAMTFPAPIAVFSFDIGGIAPVLANLPEVPEYDEIRYDLPIIDSDPPKPYAKEAWHRFDDDYKAALAGGKYKTIVLDTATAIWEIVRHAVAEEVGQKKLLEVQYTLPNLRMNSLFTRAKISGLNFVATHYLRDKRIDGNSTGELETDGWRRTEGQVDLVLWTKRDSRKEAGGKSTNFITTTIKDNRYSLKLNGLSIENADYNKICTLMGFS